MERAAPASTTKHRPIGIFGDGGGIGACIILADTLIPILIRGGKFFPIGLSPLDLELLLHQQCDASQHENSNTEAELIFLSKNEFLS